MPMGRNLARERLNTKDWDLLYLSWCRSSSPSCRSSHVGVEVLSIPSRPQPLMSSACLASAALVYLKHALRSHLDLFFVFCIVSNDSRCNFEIAPEYDLALMKITNICCQHNIVSMKNHISLPACLRMHVDAKAAAARETWLWTIACARARRNAKLGREDLGRNASDEW